MDHRPQAWGRPRDDVYGPYDASYLHASGPKQMTQAPVVTGTSVIALKFKDGVVMAADNLASYGSLARFSDVKRLRVFANSTVIGFGGDVSDMQFLDRHLNELAIEESYSSTDAGSAADREDESQPASASAAGVGVLTAANLHSYLAKLMYRRRNSFDPLWNQLLVAGFDNDTSSSAGGKPYLASVDLRGTSFTSPSLATGFGSQLAQPILRRYAPDEASAAALTREQAVEAVRECMKVLYYRDARSLDRYSLAVVTRAGGVELKEDEVLEKQSWAFAERIRGYGTQTA